MQNQPGQSILTEFSIFKCVAVTNIVVDSGAAEISILKMSTGSVSICKVNVPKDRAREVKISETNAVEISTLAFFTVCSYPQVVCFEHLVLDASCDNTPIQLAI